MMLLFHWIQTKNQVLMVSSVSPRILQSCAEVLFRPLHHLFTISLRYGLIPTGWKVHKIVSVFKAGDPGTTT